MSPKRNVKSARERIEVELEGAGGVEQPDDILICPFGVQVYSPRPLVQHDPVELSVSVRNGGGEAEKYTCLGFTIDSVRKNGEGLYCNYIKFLHVPDALYPHILCDGPSDHCICNFCEGDLSERLRKPGK